FRKGRLPEEFNIVGVSRTAMSDEEWACSLENYVPWDDSSESFTKKWLEFTSHLVYFPGDATEKEVVLRLKSFLKFIENDVPCKRVYYLATSPDIYIGILNSLECETEKKLKEKYPVRIVIEKPFGSDLESAKILNKKLHVLFQEKDIFRIDHYLGKETAQNLLVLRFANSIFEPIWNRYFIQEIQITASEEALIGKRSGYYNRAGILRDMFQNHLLQLLTLVAMEPPVKLDSENIRNEKVKILNSILPFKTPEDVEKRTIRGAYIQLPPVLGEEEENRLEPTTPTFAAVEFRVENWRWKDVPFYVRSGKGMSCGTTQILLRFRQPPHLLFPESECEPDALLIQLQPAEGIQLYFQTKVPETAMEISQASMNFTFAEAFQSALPSAYERLLLDIFTGDSGLFIRSDEMEAAWRIIDPIQEAWDGDLWRIPYSYPIGSWGPTESENWLEKRGSRWFNVCPVMEKISR
ncbi:MAG: glucose-6-phosphate dehydrogenase, partial [Planctomycetia bacterium]|nr:glucose-6-phosphate dehydrogenase [Planctomycetia bacterium]